MPPKETKSKDASAIIVGAGKGLRMNSSTPKQFLQLKNRPVIAYALEAFGACDKINEIYLVVSKGEVEFCRETLLPSLELAKPIQLVEGGLRRQDSVYNGLLAMEGHEGVVVIHDGVRPFVKTSQIAACISRAETFGACMLGMPVGDTLKRVGPSQMIEETIPRDNMWQAQTPQAFQYTLIRSAHDRAAREGFAGTDDASLVERCGGEVKVIKGSAGNIKITLPEDLAMAEVLLMLEG
ncbi:MAG: 2-C-methyl-D-erythritol 4-phosphate cytidylyltransferase [Thermodesulfobacteriota bacterium]